MARTRIPLIKIQLTRFGDMAGASRVRPIINIHYLSCADVEDVSAHVHSSSLYLSLSLTHAHRKKSTVRDYIDVKMK